MKLKSFRKLIEKTLSKEEIAEIEEEVRKEVAKLKQDERNRQKTHLCEDYIDDERAKDSYAKCSEVDGKLEIEIHYQCSHYTYAWPVKYCPFCGYKIEGAK
jgi:hypothetical protein